VAQDRRSQRKREVGLPDLDDLVAPDLPMEGRVMRDELRGKVRAALAKLRREWRQLLVLRDIEGLSYAEICAITGLPPGTVRSGLHRARLALHRKLRPYLEGG
jgi:RNA polymerase sigma-70 factor (ECF subfamily)